jgi:hypothetical protein
MCAAAPRALWRRLAALTALVALFCVLCAVEFWDFRGLVPPLPSAFAASARAAVEHDGGALRAPPRTLVIFVYAEDGDFARENLAFFLRVGVTIHDDALTDYAIVVTRGLLTVDAPELRAPHVTVLQDDGACADAGAYAAALRDRRPGQYAHFIFINSRVRGPILPRYSQRAGIHWTRAFTALIDETAVDDAAIKWAGASISCATQPHVQAGVIVTDAEGLGIATRAGVFECRAATPKSAAAWEIGASRAIFDAGFNIGSLMTRYFGVDFRPMKGYSDLSCNQDRSPAVRGGNDGFDLDPFEVVFVPFHEASSTSYDALLRRHADYAFQRDVLAESEATHGRSAVELAAHFISLGMCNGVFDSDFYRKENADLRAYNDAKALAHWASHGEAEHRIHRIVAGPDTPATSMCARVMTSYAWVEEWKHAWFI